MPHIPVLLDEALALLDPKPGESFVDATLGNGGHAAAILKKIAPRGKLLGIDCNKDAIMKTKKKFQKEIRSGLFIAAEGNFADILKIARRNRLSRPNGIIADLGMSSEELEESERGFSFQKDEPLLMTYSANPGANALTAEKIVNAFSENELANIFHEFGEERYAKRYARAIVSSRGQRPIRTSGRLAKIIEFQAPRGRNRSRIHPATRIFQALRIAVNNELNNLECLLRDGFNLLGENGRLVIISYHSLEDRMVKRAFKEKALTCAANLLVKKPVRPSIDEIRRNPRSRSAKLRAIQKIKASAACASQT